MTCCAKEMSYNDMKSGGGRTVRHHLLRGYFIVGATFGLQFIGDGTVVTVLKTDHCLAFEDIYCALRDIETLTTLR